MVCSGRLFRFRNPNVDGVDVVDKNGNALNPENMPKATKSNWNNEHFIWRMLLCTVHQNIGFQRSLHVAMWVIQV